MLQERIRQVRVKIAELTTRANQLYGITLPPIQVRFDLRGRAAGMAGYDRTGYYVRFNTDMMQNQAWDHVYNDTVPHELAHLVCFFRNTDRGHGSAWRRTCQQLGGSGDRCHKEQVTYATGNTYYYTTSTGHTITLSSIRHKKIQNYGFTYRFRDGKGTVDRTCSYTTQRPAVNQPRMQMAAQAPSERPAANPVIPAGATKADQVRAKIRELKAQVGSEGFQRTIQWAVDNLQMTRALATSYVKNNWNKV
jgi:predicted SprT family Zn-dependent metalloprotease